MLNIERLSGKVPNTNKIIDIDIGIKNLVIIGENGCGKTSLITSLYEKMKFLYLEKHYSTQKENIIQHRYWKERLEGLTKGSQEHSQTLQQIIYYDEKLNKVNDGLKISITDEDDFSSNLEDKKAVLQFFPAVRKSEIRESTGSNQSIYKSTQRNLQNTNDGAHLEQHLVNLKTIRSFAITEDKNESLAATIQEWFDDFEDNLRYLLEDDSFSLEFESTTFKFHLLQEGKPKYNFQNLSSGYSAIMDILADLIMKAELGKVSPKDLTGVVIIDEIDAHLHISLQRKILPFLTKNFPSLQFIVTTHSPFVITSEENVVIYDLSKMCQYEQLTMISYEYIVEGLLGIPPVSTTFENKIKNLSSLIDDYSTNEYLIKSLTSELLPFKDKMDSESLSFLLKAESEIMLNKDNSNV